MQPPADRVSERIATGLREDGAPVRLEMVFFRPAGKDPFPTVVFHHGSTGRGDDPRRFGATWSPPRVARFFTERGWMVVFPQRRGRGRSDGRYAEGLGKGGYSCDPAIALAGFDRALEDADAILAALRARPDIDPKRLLAAGQSRGGVLAIGHAGTQPDAFVGAVNVVGGWMTDRCPRPEAINPVAFRRGGPFRRPTLWLYGEDDPYYRMAHSRRNFQAFVDAGGTGEFHALRLPRGASGHGVLGYPDLWEKPLGRYLDRLG